MRPTHRLTIELHLPQKTPTQLIGATRQRGNQILKEWERKGFVAQHGNIILLDRAPLENVGH